MLEWFSANPVHQQINARRNGFRLCGKAGVTLLYFVDRIVQIIRYHLDIKRNQTSIPDQAAEDEAFKPILDAVKDPEHCIL